MKQLLKSFSLWLVVFLALGLFLGQARSQSPPLCMERMLLVKLLASDFDEHLAKVHVDEKTKLRIEFFKNEKSGTWTIIAVSDKNVACVISFGEDEPARPDPMSYTL
ncbi:hypothetical protein LCGC14_0610400 [marine sediment metagenome]|uniref:Uncharacterized protein n=1 Tax=marine sediment metagenome TaxID=412755 RepID=A0A0F9TU41_9ZZZZ